MKHKPLVFFCGLALAIFVGCSSTATNTHTGQSRANQTVSRSTVPYFTGSGGKGMSLAILVPESTGLNENQAYLPRMVQGALVSNISKYSGISVLDRVSLDKVISETLDPTYKDNFDIVRLGHVAQVGHMMTGNITRTSTGYVLQISVTETTPDARTTASYTGTSTAAQLDDFSAIHRASMELLEQMGVELTGAARTELAKASSSQEIGAQTNLAQGIVAQQRGTVVEAMAYYYDAVSFDPQLSEASGRLSTLSSTFTSGNIGENVRNAIQQRNEWLKFLADAEDYFSSHLPFELVYSSSLTQGRIDYARETVELTTSLNLKPSGSFKVLNDLMTGLEATGKREEWGLQFWPTRPAQINDPGATRRSLISGIFSLKPYRTYFPEFYDSRNSAEKEIDVTAALLDENGTAISTANSKLNSGIRFAVTGRGRTDIETRFNDNMRGPEGKIWLQQSPYWYVVDTTKLEATEDQERIPFTVNANDITDKLTIKIVSVDGVDVAQNPNYIKITAEN